MSPDVAASIKARLLDHAKAHTQEFEWTLTRFAAERVLFRLGASAARDRCILKGASLLAVWLPDPYRATRDIDLLATGPAEDAGIRSLVEEICAMTCPEDALNFDLSKLVIETIRAETQYPGKRARFCAHLGNARILVQLDIGFGDALAVEPQEIEYPTILKALPTPRLRCYSRESAVAEKFEAMVTLGTRNSRMKDFHDVWALAGRFAFDGPALEKAIAACFERRATLWTAQIPRPLTAEFYQDSTLDARWRSYLAAGSVLVPPPAQFAQIGERIIRFLGPVQRSIGEGTPFDRVWCAGGPWVPRSEEAPL